MNEFSANPHWRIGKHDPFGYHRCLNCCHGLLVFTGEYAVTSSTSLKSRNSVLGQMASLLLNDRAIDLGSRPGEPATLVSPYLEEEESVTAVLSKISLLRRKRERELIDGWKSEDGLLTVLTPQPSKVYFSLRRCCRS
jgi:hypothetical protein